MILNLQKYTGPSMCDFFKWAIPGIFFLFVQCVSTKRYKILQQMYKMSIHYLNPQPSGHESPALSIRLGLPPQDMIFY